MKLRILYYNSPAPDAALQSSVDEFPSVGAARCAYEMTGAIVYNIEVLDFAPALGPQEPPDDYRIFNRRRAVRTARRLALTIGTIKSTRSRFR